MTDAHRKQLRRIALVMGAIIPIVLYGTAALAMLNAWDVIDSARASAVFLMCVLAIGIFTPLALDHPLETRQRGFVVFWFCLSTFFNVTWQVPLILFRSVITTARHTHANLFKFIPWWGYGLCDWHYGRVTPWMMSEELWWLLAIVISVVGLVELRRNREARGMLLLGVAGALEAYNASLYIVENAFVDHFENVPSESMLALMAYWGFNLLWAVAAAMASTIALRSVLKRAET